MQGFGGRFVFGVQVEPISPLIRIQNLREIIVTQRNDLIKFPFKLKEIVSLSNSLSTIHLYARLQAKDI